MTGMKTLITGAIAYDVLLGFEGSYADVIKPEELDRLAVSFFSPHCQERLGGCGGNIAWNLKLLDGDPLLVGVVGEDGDAYLDAFTEKGISTEWIARVDGKKTATAIIGTDSSERQISFFHPGADVGTEWPELSAVSPSLGHAIVSPRDVSMMTAAMELCSTQGIPVIFDPGQQVHMFSADEMERMVRMSAGVVVNEYEWSIVQDRLNCTEENFQMFAPLLVITQAEHGVVAFDSSGAINVPACTPDRVVNPTGAGDAFRSGLLYGLQSDWPLLHCLRLGCSMGSFAVESEGTQIEHVEAAEIFTRSESTYAEKFPVG